MSSISSISCENYQWNNTYHEQHYCFECARNKNNIQRNFYKPQIDNFNPKEINMSKQKNNFKKIEKYVKHPYRLGFNEELLDLKLKEQYRKENKQANIFFSSSLLFGLIFLAILV